MPICPARQAQLDAQHSTKFTDLFPFVPAGQALIAKRRYDRLVDPPSALIKAFLKDCPDWGTDPQDCWIWRGHTAPVSGGYRYGRIPDHDGYVYAHRMAFRLYTGHSPGRSEIGAWSCQNSLCCNPNHFHKHGPFVTGIHRKTRPVRDPLRAIRRAEIFREPLRLQ